DGGRRRDPAGPAGLDPGASRPAGHRVGQMPGLRCGLRRVRAPAPTQPHAVSGRRPRHPAALAVVAAFNEGDTIAATVKELAALPDVRTVVVAADGCTDDTVAEAQGAGATVV